VFWQAVYVLRLYPGLPSLKKNVIMLMINISTSGKLKQKSLLTKLFKP